MSLRFIFVDLDSYFASCEQQRNPKLRGQPIGVIPMQAETTCCIAASYEAKAYGVKTGTTVREARWLCPQIQFVIAGHADYVKIHQQVIDGIQENCLPAVTVRSIDEFSAEIPPNWRNEKDARALADRMRRTITKCAGEYIGCSIGIGPNVFLSKIASGMNKPRGLTLIRSNDLPGPLATLELRDIYGIGRRMHTRLMRRGVRTVSDLYACSRAKLHSIWGGVGGDRLYAELRGEIIEHAETVRRQVSHSHVLPPQCRNREDAFAVIHRLTQKAAMRLRKLDHYAGSLSLGVRLGFDNRWGMEARFFPTQESRIFLRALRELWAKIPPDTPEPCKVSMVLGDLVSAQNYTNPLFTEMNNPRNVKLDQAMDSLNKRFGSRTLYYAGAHNGRDEAPMRIAFSHIPDLSTEADDLLAED
ncbi:DNA polymerase thumb domain-containing protein [Cerasicoccus arenae]|uniref:DNA polymerase IV n=1 Tax=Cerasicoccus arenae TaxID=424488 RepID=A0A8J3DI40_9BACT|nr:DNA-directed DNA polymerase [Cerasicoccus arenae]MBK1859051.1 hypothetical protein [Cerasicoccus arenae]GHC03345.1 DNA polymerase IV [Cerasicoccus arenae]